MAIHARPFDRKGQKNSSIVDEYRRISNYCKIVDRVDR